jgi:hypothetical protein
LEETGVYSLDLAVAHDSEDGKEVAVLNPKVASRFARLFGGQRPMRQTPKYWRNTVGECPSHHILTSCQECYTSFM